VAEQKSHAPTARKLKEARRQGNVLKSPNVTSAAVLSGCFITLYCAGEWLWIKNQILLQYLLVQGVAVPQEMLALMLQYVVVATSLFLVVVAVCGMLAEFLVVGFSIEWQVLAPKFSRLNPGEGLKRITSGFRDLWLTVLYVLLFVSIAYIMANRLVVETPVVAGDPLAVIKQSFAGNFWRVVLSGCFVFSIAGAVEYLWKRKQYFRDLSMNIDDLRREHKEDEGDPHIRSFRKLQHRELALQDLVKQVRQARVIIVERAD
jgi:flagellar biosynthesis protein FlhB